MGSRKRWVVLVGCVALVAACGPTISGDGGSDGRVTDVACEPGQVRCDGNSYQVCPKDVYVEQELCAAVCSPENGCQDCVPGRRVCVGDDSYSCGEDGQADEFLESCGLERCSGGSCGGDTCSAGAELIYLVDVFDNLYSFDPGLLPGDPYHLIGALSCPDSTSPFSMAVDRSATAWVQYSSGKIFEVDTADASCTATNFTPQFGFTDFGMGFVSDAPGSSDETLYVSGQPVLLDGRPLGRLLFPSLTIERLGALADAEEGPELTGTGAAELFAYFPGQTNSFVAKLDKVSGGNLQSWPIPGLAAAPRAWAFAHHGGRFYIFVTIFAGQADGPSNVYLLDPATGDVTVAAGDTGKVIVGAGVSTCAPVIVN